MIFTCLLSATLNPSKVEGSVLLQSGKAAGQAVVWLDGATKSKPMSRAIVDQRDRKFIPHVSIVTVDTEISFPNNDTVFHNVFAAFDAKKFDLGLYARGKTKVQKFPKPGLVALMCSIHSEMSAYVMVVDTPFYAVANAKGNFSIKGVEPGSYTLRVWHESGEVSQVKITVPVSDPVKVKTARK